MHCCNQWCKQYDWYNDNIINLLKTKKNVKKYIINKLRIDYIYYEYQISINVDKNVCSTIIKQRENVDHIVLTICNNFSIIKRKKFIFIVR